MEMEFRPRRRFSIVCITISIFISLGLGQANAQKPKKPPRVPKGSAQEAINKGQIPYLGPGADRMTPEKYEKHYGDYIKEAIRMGFPPSKCEDGACTQSLQQLFRRSGLFDYPVPPTAELKTWKNAATECYMVGGVLAQVRRDRNKDLRSATVIFSKSPKAMPILFRACREKPLRTQQAEKSGLERIGGMPIGYPHPYLCSASQGLYVQSIDFLQEKGECRAVNYVDNSWSNGHNVNEKMCFETQKDVEFVWQNKLKPHDFVMRERKRTRTRLRAKAVAQGASRSDADLMIRKLYLGPLDHDFTYVGIAMRNLEACNQYVVGGLSLYTKFKNEGTAKDGGSSGKSGGGSGVGAE